MSDWKDADDNAWIDKQQRLKELDPLDHHLVETMKISYMTGKGNHDLVPVLFPNDTVAAVRKLAKMEFRAKAGVLEKN